jgi:hypothetical protein
MELRTPPRLAVLLLKWLGLLDNEPFAGDLIEEYRHGRTAGWFWRQALTAIRAGVGRATRMPNVQALFVAYGITAPPILGFLQIHGMIHIQPSLTSVLAVVVFLVALLWANGEMRLPGYWGKVAHECGNVFEKNCVLVLFLALRSETCVPLYLLVVNFVGLGLDLLSMRAKARRESRFGRAAGGRA